MAITVSFTTSQVVGAPSQIVLVDTSTGSDVTAVGRRVYLVDAQGRYWTSSGSSTTSAYTNFPLASGSSITITALDEDMALNVTLSYVNSGGSVVATGTTLVGFTLYNETFYYSLTQAQAQQNMPPPVILQDSNYYTNKMILRVNIDSGNQAISLGSDITSAQNCYSMATYMVSKEDEYF